MTLRALRRVRRDRCCWRNNSVVLAIVNNLTRGDRVRRRTWALLDWPDKPERVTSIELACPKCGREAFLSIGDPGALIIAAIGLGVIFDPPGHVPPTNFMPTAIRCRGCRTVWSNAKEPASVR